MYFCEDHGSLSDDGTGTVLHFQGSGADSPEPLQPPPPPPSPPLPRQSSPPLRPNGVLCSQPLVQHQGHQFLKLQDQQNLHQPQLLQPGNCGGTWTPGSPSDGGGNRSGGNRSSLDNEDDLGSSQEAEASSHSQTSQPEQQLPPTPATAVAAAVTVLPTTGGANGLHRLGATSGTYILQAAAAAGCGYQEVREISLGRHNEEPFGMKVECVGEGFFITHVVRNSVAACAGLKVGDEIVRINDRRLEGLRTKEVLQVIRQSELCVKLAYKPRAVVARIREVRLKKANGLIGLRLQKKPDGLYIDYVKRGTVAFEAGLKEGDQVLKINSHIVTDWSMEGAMALLKSLGDSEQLVLLVRETLPIAHLTAAAGNSSAAQPAFQQHHKHQQQQQHHHHLNDGQHQEDVPDSSDKDDRAAVQNGAPEDEKAAAQQQPPSQQLPPPTEAAATAPSPEEERRKARAPGSNPCASTDDLEITRLPPDDASESATKGGGSALPAGTTASAAGPSGSFSSNFLKSFHGPSRLTAFLKSTRLNRQPVSAPAASASKDKGHIA